MAFLLFVFNGSKDGPIPVGIEECVFEEQSTIGQSLVETVERIIKFVEDEPEEQQPKSEADWKMLAKEASDAPLPQLFYRFANRSFLVIDDGGLIYKDSFKEQFHPELLPPPPKV